MKRILAGMIFLFVIETLQAQETEEAEKMHQQQLEKLAEENSDEDAVDLLTLLPEGKINLNTAGIHELESLPGLNGFQVAALLMYRRILGLFIDLHELQAVPGWDLLTIRNLLPYVTIEQVRPALVGKQVLLGGNHLITVRYKRVLEPARGYERPEPAYSGSRDAVLFRYRYQYKNKLQWGLVGEKDPGERMFRTPNRLSFDFHSAHLSIRNIGIINALVVGDFLVSLGQGLLLWQGNGFNSGIDLSFVKRQGPAIKPHTSAGEYNFYRGIGLGMKKGNFQLTQFVSLRNMDANLGIDSLGASISSLHTSGYHRTVSEIADRRSVRLISAGASARFDFNGGHIGTNIISNQFSEPFAGDDEPYRMFAVKGKREINGSLDYSFTRRNVHVFGEHAFAANRAMAHLTGIILSLDSRLDLAVLGRSFDKKYNALFARAAGQGSAVKNEHGVNLVLSLKPLHKWKINLSADVFRFPWLRYRVDRPSVGWEGSVQCVYNVSKLIELRGSVILKFQERNSSETGQVEGLTNRNYRFQCDHQVTKYFRIRTRIESKLVENHLNNERGFFMCVDWFWKISSFPMSANGRMGYFETEGADTRIYAFENDLPGAYSVGSLGGKGLKIYLNGDVDISEIAHLKANRNMKLSVKIARTMIANEASISDGNDEIVLNHKTELKFQIIIGLMK
ncbi:MAG: helix-hairpin-helix domain-containing protein [Chitinophagaceae bacterium]|nr:helix-hairpin-helix domain-containing protein [Chitinophagaceae bacterium]